MPNTPNSVIVLDQFGNIPLNISFAGPVALTGVTDGSAAVAGDVGEFMQFILADGGAGAISSGAPAALASIALTAGDWDVWGAGGFKPATAQSDTLASVSISSNPTASGPPETALSQVFLSGAALLSATVLPTPIVRVSLTTPTTFSAVAEAIWTGGATTMSVFGSISARRVR